VWSEEGLGSTFTLRIPLAAGVDRPVEEPGDDRPPVPPLAALGGIPRALPDAPAAAGVTASDHGPAGSARDDGPPGAARRGRS
jgi:two-component system sensor histidine kinase SenX3